MAGGIFISYRREDANHAAGRLADRLRQTYSRDQLFMDVDNIEPGLDFVQVLREKVQACDVLLAVIGRNWLNVRDPQGARRLDDPKDFVRIEVEAALARNVRVIPVLVDGAEIPRESDLPETLRPLVTRNAVRLQHERFGSDAEKLTVVLSRVVAPKKGLFGWVSSEKPVTEARGTSEPLAALRQAGSISDQTTTRANNAVAGVVDAPNRIQVVTLIVAGALSGLVGAFLPFGGKSIFGMQGGADVIQPDVGLAFGLALALCLFGLGLTRSALESTGIVVASVVSFIAPIYILRFLVVISPIGELAFVFWALLFAIGMVMGIAFLDGAINFIGLFRRDASWIAVLIVFIASLTLGQMGIQGGSERIVLVSSEDINERFSMHSWYPLMASMAFYQASLFWLLGNFFIERLSRSRGGEPNNR